MTAYRKNTRSSGRRHRSRKNATTSLTWVWIGIGMFMGILGAVMVHGLYTGHISLHTFWKAPKQTHAPQASASTSTPVLVNPNISNANRAKQTAHASEHTQNQEQKINSHAKSNSHAKDKIIKNKNETSAQYEFYTLLPGMEVQLPEVSNNNINPAVSNTTENIIVTRDTRDTVTANTIKATATTAKQSMITKKNTPIVAAKQNPKPPVVSRTVTKAPSVIAKPAPKPAPNVQSKVAAAHYIIQAGIFNESQKAEELKTKLNLLGFRPRVQNVNTDKGQNWYRVTLGPFFSEPAAITQKKNLEKQNINGVLILQRASG